MKTKQKIKKVIVLRNGERAALGTGQTSWEIPAQLTVFGASKIAKAVAANRSSLEGCDTFVTSPLICAQQTLTVIMRELGYELPAFDRAVFCSPLWTEEPGRYHSADPKETIAEWAKRNKRFAKAEGDRIFNYGVVATAIALTRKTALCVSHRGPIDCLLAHAKTMIEGNHAFDKIRDLEECEGMLLTFREETLVGVEELRLPA